MRGLSVGNGVWSDAILLDSSVMGKVAHSTKGYLTQEVSCILLSLNVERFSPRVRSRSSDATSQCLWKLVKLIFYAGSPYWLNPREVMLKEDVIFRVGKLKECSAGSNIVDNDKFWR